MAEVHPDPAVALSDSAQQMDLNQFDEFWNEIKRQHLLKYNNINEPFTSISGRFFYFKLLFGKNIMKNMLKLENNIAGFILPNVYLRSSIHIET